MSETATADAPAAEQQESKGKKEPFKAPEGFQTIPDAVLQTNYSKVRITKLLQAGRIPGAKKIGNRRVVPNPVMQTDKDGNTVPLYRDPVGERKQPESDAS